jgi:uncharacterized protein (DUF305 family)
VRQAIRHHSTLAAFQMAAVMVRMDDRPEIDGI